MMILAVLMSLTASLIGYLRGRQRGHREGLRDACEILKDTPTADQAASEWLRDLEREGKRYL